MGLKVRPLRVTALVGISHLGSLMGKIRMGVRCGP